MGGAENILTKRFLRCHLPMVAVVAVIAVAIILVLSDRWRRGAIVFGAATLLAGAFRLALPAERVGLLAVRSRQFDVAALLAVGTAIVVLAASIDPLGTG
jgi:hypothetical protein